MLVCLIAACRSLVRVVACLCDVSVCLSVWLFVCVLLWSAWFVWLFVWLFVSFVLACLHVWLRGLCVSVFVCSSGVIVWCVWCVCLVGVCSRFVCSFVCLVVWVCLAVSAVWLWCLPMCLFGLGCLLFACLVV